MAGNHSVGGSSNTTYSFQPQTQTQTHPFRQRLPYFPWVPVIASVAAACLVKFAKQEPLRLLGVSVLANLAGETAFAYVIRKEKIYSAVSRIETRAWHLVIKGGTYRALICGALLAGTAYVCKNSSTLTSRKAAPWLGGFAILALAIKSLSYRKNSSDQLNQRIGIRQRVIDAVRAGFLFQLGTTAVLAGVAGYRHFSAPKV